jgi:ADP-heptose:LPS heptosyltransferase
MQLPERFVTCQWDSNDRARTLKPHLREMVMDNYRRQGYEVVTVGGESSDKDLNWSLKHIAYAMSKAEMHVGVDSAFMHMAFLYNPYKKIHIYNEPNGFYSHHARRAIDNGVKLNQYYTPIRLPDGTIL